MKRAVGLVMMATLVIPTAVTANIEPGDIVSDEDWCEAATETYTGEWNNCENTVNNLATLIEKHGLPVTWATTILDHEPTEDQVVEPVVQGSDPDGSASTEENAGVEPVVQPVIPLPLPKRDYKAVADGERRVFGPGKRFDRKSLKVWVDGERGELWSVNAKKGTFELWSAPAEGAIVQADYTRLVKSKFKRTLRGNGSDDFYVKLPKSVMEPLLRFTVRADSPYGCSAYVYVRDYGSWEPQDDLGMSFDGRKTKTRTQGYSDLYGGRNRIWVSTNCPWTLTISQSVLKNVK